jgi:hypothetical protein
VRFVKKLLIEALEIAEVVGVQFATVQGLDHPGDARALFTHADYFRARRGGGIGSYTECTDNLKASNVEGMISSNCDFNGVLAVLT